MGPLQRLPHRGGSQSHALLGAPSQGSPGPVVAPPRCPQVVHHLAVLLHRILSSAAATVVEAKQAEALGEERGVTPCVPQAAAVKAKQPRQPQWTQLVMAVAVGVARRKRRALCRPLWRWVQGWGRGEQGVDCRAQSGVVKRARMNLAGVTGQACARSHCERGWGLPLCHAACSNRYAPHYQIILHSGRDTVPSVPCAALAFFLAFGLAV